MSRAFDLRFRFAGAALAGVLGAGLMLLSGGCNDDRNYTREQQERQASVARLEERYSGSPRLRAIAAELNKNFGYDEYGNRVDWLFSNNVTLELSTECMPPDAMIQVFKCRLRINPFLRVQDQAQVLSLVIPYIEGQIKDGLSYGAGESFTIAAGRLIPTSHVAPIADARTACSFSP